MSDIKVGGAVASVILLVSIVGFLSLSGRGAPPVPSAAQTDSTSEDYDGLVACRPFERLRHLIELPVDQARRYLREQRLGSAGDDGCIVISEPVLPELVAKVEKRTEDGSLCLKIPFFDGKCFWANPILSKRCVEWQCRGYHSNSDLACRPFERYQHLLGLGDDESARWEFQRRELALREEEELYKNCTSLHDQARDPDEYRVEKTKPGFRCIRPISSDGKFHVDGECYWTMAFPLAAAHAENAEPNYGPVDKNDPLALAVDQIVRLEYAQSYCPLYVNVDPDALTRKLDSLRDKAFDLAKRDKATFQEVWRVRFNWLTTFEMHSYNLMDKPIQGWCWQQYVYWRKDKRDPSTGTYLWRDVFLQTDVVDKLHGLKPR